MQKLSVQRRILIIAALLPATSGCGRSGPDYAALDLAAVHGRVTLDGTCLENALVLFESDDGAFSFALTDRRGDYQMMFNSEKPGVTKGTKTVRIWSSRAVPGMSEATGGANGLGRARPERVPARYNDRSELEAKVENDAEQFDFDLKTFTNP